MCSGRKSRYFSSSSHLAAELNVKPGGSCVSPVLVFCGHRRCCGAEPDHLGRGWEVGRCCSGRLRAAPSLVLPLMAAFSWLPGKTMKVFFGCHTASSREVVGVSVFGLGWPVVSDLARLECLAWCRPQGWGRRGGMLERAVCVAKGQWHALLSKPEEMLRILLGRHFQRQEAMLQG